MTITSLLDAPFYTGGGASSLVPSVFPVAINGRPYFLDTQPETYYVRWNTETLPYLRQQADQSNAPSEQSLNPQGLWRRAQDSWHYGAGQVFRDRDANSDQDAIRYRFRSSKGIDPWTRYQLGLLDDTVQKKSSANTNLYCVVAGSRLYYCDGSTLYRTTDLTTFTAVTGYTGGTITSMTSDGYTVYFTDGADIWTTNTGTGAATSADTSSATLLRYVKGRLIVAIGNVLENIPVLGSAASMTFTHANSAFTWVDACEGNAVIYAAGYAGDKSIIYRTAIKADGTALDIPVVAATLPDGEIVRSIQGYLGFVWIGSDKGVRFCEADASGNLTIGPVISTPAAVMAFEPQDRFMWFGWSNYDAASTGLGRIDLTAFVGNDQPAYASDLMVTGQGTITSIATFTNLRVLTVSGLGIYADSGTLVASGTIDMGVASFGLPDPKVGVSLDVRAGSSAGTVTAYVATDDGTMGSIGTDTTPYAAADDGVYPLGGSNAERYEVRLVLARSSTTVGPNVLRWTLKVLPTSADGPAEILHLPIMLYPSITERGVTYFYDVLDELDELGSLRESREVVQLQYFDRTYTGFVADFKNFPYGVTDEVDGSWGLKTTCLVDFQRLT